MTLLVKLISVVFLEPADLLYSHCVAGHVHKMYNYLHMETSVTKSTMPSFSIVVEVVLFKQVWLKIIIDTNRYWPVSPIMCM